MKRMIVAGVLAVAAASGACANRALVPVAQIEKTAYDWTNRHERILREQRAMDPDIVLLGDSITHEWAGRHSIGGDDAMPRFKRAFEGYRVLDAGYGFDRIQNVLWRLDNGELDGTRPKLVVLLAGTNNMNEKSKADPTLVNSTPEEIAEGVIAIADRLRRKLPEARILVLGIFPRGRKAGSRYRVEGSAANRLIAAGLTGMERVSFADISTAFLDENGEFPEELSYDAVHLKDAGFVRWRAALQPWLVEMDPETSVFDGRRATSSTSYDLKLTESGSTGIVLVVREKSCVDEWRVTEDCRWFKKGTWLACGTDLKGPYSIAAADGIVYIGDSSGDANGAILKYSPEGKFLGVLASVPARPEALAINGGYLYVCSAFGKNANQLFRYRLSDGKGGVYGTSGLSVPRTLAFGADGLLYTANRGSGEIAVFDVSGDKPALKAAYQSPAQAHGGMLLDHDRDRLLIPCKKPEAIDLITGTAKRSLIPIPVQNAFSAAFVNGEACFADHTGKIIAWNPDTGATTVRATGVQGACDLLNLTEALDGTAERRRTAAAARLRAAGKVFAYKRFDQERPYDYTPLKYNNPDVTPYLKTGLICYPMAFDYDGDGDLDLVVSNWGIPTWRGTWYFENPTAKGTKNATPVFKPARKVGEGCNNVSAKTYPDGRVAVLRQNQITWEFSKTGWEGLKTLAGLPWNIHYNNVRCNMWRLADYDGDGRDDLIVGIGDWVQYGWHNAYDENGNWKNGQIHGHVYWIRNEAGADGAEKWGTPRIVRLENETPVDVFGNAMPMFHDWDGDGDLDLIVGDFLDNFTYYENIGTRTAPVYTSGRLLRDSTGVRLHGELCIITPAAVDWDGDGLMDMVSGEEDGRVAFYRNTGNVVDRMPVFDPPVFLRQQADLVNFGILCTPAGVDWDGDGDYDLICGNSTGYICFFENLSGPGVAEPKWAEAKLLSCEPFDASRDFASRGGMLTAAPIRIMARHNGSIQGPAEAKWGYTCLSVADWDGDGLPDIMANSIWGKPLLFRNIGTRTAPKLAAPVGIEVEWAGEQPELEFGWYKPKKTDNPKELITQWRTTPVMFDMNGDGLTDLVMVDQQGDLAFFERTKKDGKLVLKAPRKAFRDENCEVIHPTARKNPQSWDGGIGGATGRRKITICDWNGDGKPDLIMSGKNSRLYIQTGMRDGDWIFVDAGDMSEQQLAAHTTNPTTVDFDNDGIPEVVLGCEDGFLYHLKNNDWRVQPDAHN